MFFFNLFDKKRSFNQYLVFDRFLSLCHLARLPVNRNFRKVLESSHCKLSWLAYFLLVELFGNPLVFSETRHFLCVFQNWNSNLSLLWNSAFHKFLIKIAFPVLFLRFFNPLRANPTKWSNTLKQFVGNSRQIAWVCLTILWDWRLKG